MLDVQADSLEGLNTRLVIPLMAPGEGPDPGRRLNPLFVVAGQPLHLVTQYMASVRSSILTGTGHSLREHADEITAAIDMLLHGF